MGTPALAATSLEALMEAGPKFEVVATVTQPDQPKGRGLKLQPSPVKEAALRQALPVLQPARARDPLFLEELRGYQPDVIVVAAYGQILPQSILDLPPLGCVNVHTSLLPKYRGAAPIQRALWEGETQTGITLMKMDAGLDTGAILARCKTPIYPEDTAQTLHDRLAGLGAKLLVETLPALAAGRITPQPQPLEGVSYARKINKSDGRIDWSQPARTIHIQLRALTPWPGIHTYLPAQSQPVLLKIWEAAVSGESGRCGCVLRSDKDGIVVGCGAESLRVLVLQREGGRRMSAAEFLAGNPLAPGQQLE